MEKRIFRYNREFILESGEILPELEICYHISKEFGTESGRSKKVVWITHALTANSNPCEWWDTLVGEGKFLDPRKYTIVCANILGSCYGSTSPLSINPKTGEPYMLSFPKCTIRDVAGCHELLRKEIGIETIDMLVGGSVGGFQAIEWSLMNGDCIKNLVMLASNERVTPWHTASNESQRMSLQADPTFMEQQYTIVDGKVQTKGGEKGLAAARAQALISYRSYEGYNSTQFEMDEDIIWARRAATYEQHQGKKLTDRFNAYSYLCMLDLCDSHNVGRHRSGTDAALGEIKSNTLCIGIDSDNLFPPAEQKSMAERIPNGKFKQISSLYGHDGFLLEWQQIEEIFREII